MLIVRVEHVWVPESPDERRSLGEIVELLREALERIGAMSKELDDLKAAVGRIDQAVPAVAAVVTGIAAQIKANADDQAAMEQLATDLNTQADTLAQSALAGTGTGGGAPTGPAPTPPAPPTPAAPTPPLSGGTSGVPVDNGTPTPPGGANP